MKKVICIILIIFILTGILCGCQATPEEPIVIGKNQNTMIEKAKEKQETEKPQQETEEPEAEPEISAEELRLQEELGIPERYEKTIEDSDKLKLVIDAEVIVPNQGRFPITRVQGVNFSQEQVTSMYHAVCGEERMYPAVLSKEMLEERIVDAQRKMATAATEEDKQFYKNHIAELKNEYSGAPAEVDITPSEDALLETLDVNVAGMPSGEVTSVVLGDRQIDGKEFTVENNVTYKKQTDEQNVYEDENGNVVVDSQDHVLNAYMRYNRCGYGKNMIYTDRLYRLGYVTEQSLNGEVYPKAKLQITPREARLIVEEFLEKAKLNDFMIDEVTLVSDTVNEPEEEPVQGSIGYGGAETGKVSLADFYSNETHAYLFKILRSVDGIGVTFDYDSTGGSDESYAAEWFNEAIYIAVDDDGIRDVDWMAPLSVQETLVEDAALMSFDEICKIFEKMFYVKFEAQAAESGELTEYCITKARLSLMRINEKDRSGTGLLVPVWNFYGYTASGGGLPSEQEYPKITINAVDGSIIDPIKGY